MKEKEVVLLVDDSSSIRSLIRGIIQFEDKDRYHIFGMGDVKSAMSFLEKKTSKSKKIISIFLDIEMPKTDGFEMVKLIRSSDKEYIKSIPILAFTGNHKKHSREEYLKRGFDEFISKPVSSQIFFKKWFDVLKRKKMGKFAEGEEEGVRIEEELS